jgi:hypothetical protein
MYLAIMTGSSISVPSTYILFLKEMQKRQIRRDAIIDILVEKWSKNSPEDPLFSLGVAQ